MGVGSAEERQMRGAGGGRQRNFSDLGDLGHRLLEAARMRTGEKSWGGNEAAPPQT